MDRSENRRLKEEREREMREAQEKEIREKKEEKPKENKENSVFTQKINENSNGFSLQHQLKSDSQRDSLPSEPSIDLKRVSSASNILGNIMILENPILTLPPKLSLEPTSSSKSENQSALLNNIISINKQHAAKTINPVKNDVISGVKQNTEEENKEKHKNQLKHSLFEDLKKLTGLGVRMDEHLKTLEKSDSMMTMEIEKSNERLRNHLKEDEKKRTPENSDFAKSETTETLSQRKNSEEKNKAIFTEKTFASINKITSMNKNSEEISTKGKTLLENFDFIAIKSNLADKIANVDQSLKNKNFTGFAPQIGKTNLNSSASFPVNKESSITLSNSTGVKREVSKDGKAENFPSSETKRDHPRESRFSIAKQPEEDKYQKGDVSEDDELLQIKQKSN